MRIMHSLKTTVHASARIFSNSSIQVHHQKHVLDYIDFEEVPYAEQKISFTYSHRKIISCACNLRHSYDHFVVEP